MTSKFTLLRFFILLFSLCISTYIYANDNVTDFNNCNLTISDVITTASTCDNGSIVVNATGGSRPYSYSIDGFNTEKLTNDFSALTAGTYIVKVRDAKNCEASKVVTVEDKKLQLLQSSTTKTTCYEMADGTASLKVIGGTLVSNSTPYIVSLTKDNVAYADAQIQYSVDAEVSIDFSGLLLGNYAGTLKDANGCELAFDFKVEGPEKLDIANIWISDLFCYGDAGGVISFNIIGGTAPYTVTSTDPDFAGIITITNDECKIVKLAAGDYEFSIADANGCTVSTTQSIIGRFPELIYEPKFNTPICPNTPTAKVFGEAEGGSGSYRYTLKAENFEYNKTNETGSFGHLRSGKYIATVADANDCRVSDTLYIYQGDILTVDALKNKPAANVTCKDDKTASVTFTVAGRKEVVAVSDTARYYSVKLFDITNQEEIIGPNLKYTNKFHPVLTKNRVEKEPVLDENGEFTYNEEGELITKNVTYKDTLWTDGCHEPTKNAEVFEVSHREYTEDLQGFDCDDKITVSGLGAGAYKISFYKGDCQFGEEMTFTVGITGSLPSAQINNVESFCDGSEYTISPTIVAKPGISKYVWTLGDEIVGNKKDLTRTFTLEDNNKTLKLDVTNQCGSSTSNIVITKVNKRPTALIETNTDICRNPQSEVSIKFTGKAPFMYMLPDSTEKTTEEVFVKEAISADSDAIFTLLSLKDQNCESIADQDINSIEIIQPDVLSVEPLESTPATTVVCDADQNASISFTIVGRKGFVASTDSATYYTVKLFNIDKQEEVPAKEFKFTSIFHPVITGERVEQEPVLDENGEPTLDELGEIITQEVTYKDTLWTEGCFEPSKVAELEKYNYNETMFGFDCNDKISISELGAGAYSISFYRGECEFGEPQTFTIEVTGSAPSAYINEVGSFCNETEVTLTPTIESTPNVTKYQWTLDDEVIGESKDLKRAFTLEENNKTLKLTITNACGTTVSNAVSVVVNPRPTALLETSKGYLCKNQPTEVSITLTGAGPFTYTLPDGTERIVTDVYSISEVIPARDTIFTLVSLKDENCAAFIGTDVNTVETKIYPEPEYDMTITVPEPMISGRYVKVDATEGFADYTLFINDEEIPAKGPENTFWAKKFAFGESSNDFKLVVIDENGCEWTLEETKTIETTIFPNIFTPNGDGVNDIFLADYDLKVYDRQGTLMYEGTEGWDGTHNGVEANAGVYLYTLFIPAEDGNLEVIKSTLTLER